MILIIDKITIIGVSFNEILTIIYLLFLFNHFFRIVNNLSLTLFLLL